ncbi:MAG: fumarylacetoacetate hydrolase family protein [Thermodesulfobacteriota bacterium]
MKIARFLNNENKELTGILTDSQISEINGVIYSDYDESGTNYEIDKLKILPPCRPTKIIAVGLNYRDHAEEMKRQPPEDPMLFLKPNTTVIAHKEDIIYPGHMSSRVDYEGELAVVIGKEAHMIEETDSENYIFGYTCINDVTARDLQAKDIQFTRGKGFNTFAPIGPYIETEIDPSNLNIQTRLNGEVRQNSNTSNLIFNINKLVSFISNVMTLFPGDIIATGTPSGIGPMSPGDKVEVEISGIGTLTNFVVTN